MVWDLYLYVHTHTGPAHSRGRVKQPPLVVEVPNSAPPWILLKIADAGAASSHVAEEAGLAAWWWWRQGGAKWEALALRIDMKISSTGLDLIQEVVVCLGTTNIVRTDVTLWMWGFTQISCQFSRGSKTLPGLLRDCTSIARQNLWKPEM